MTNPSDRPVVINHDVEAQLGAGDHVADEPAPTVIRTCQGDVDLAAVRRRLAESAPLASDYHREQDFIGGHNHD
jgi:hypothetical protein